MSELRSILDEMAAVADEDLTVGELDADIDELCHVGQMVEMLVARKTKSMSDRGGHVELGYPSATAYLTHRSRLSAGHARQVVSRANAADKAPIAFQAWADGRLSTDQTRHVFKLAETVPDQFPAAEETLVDIIEPLSVWDTGRAVEYWRQSVDGPGELDPETQLERRGLSLSETIGGMRRVDGWLTTTAGSALETALDALMPHPQRTEIRENPGNAATTP